MASTQCETALLVGQVNFVVVRAWKSNITFCIFLRTIRNSQVIFPESNTCVTTIYAIFWIHQLVLFVEVD